MLIYLVALFASERFVSSMSSLMSRQTPSLAKLFATIVDGTSILGLSTHSQQTADRPLLLYIVFVSNTSYSRRSNRNNIIDYGSLERCVGICWCVGVCAVLTFLRKSKRQLSEFRRIKYMLS